MTRMVDVSGKEFTERRAVAEAVVRMSAGVRDKLLAGSLVKGATAETVQVAAMQAAKLTPQLIPHCHPLKLNYVSLSVEPVEQGLRLVAEVKAHERTGVEMEALVTVSVAALVVYDLCKAEERGITIERIRLLEKSGGKGGLWRAKDTEE